MNEKKSYQEYLDEQTELEEQSRKLIQYIDPTPFSESDGIDTYYEMAKDDSQVGKTKYTTGDSNEKIKIIYINIKKTIDELNKPLGFIALREQLKKNLAEPITPEYWKQWSIVKKQNINDFTNKKVKRMLKKLYEIEKIDPVFYYSLYEVYLEARSTGYDNVASEISSLRLDLDDLQAKLSNQTKNIVNDVEIKIKNNVYSEFITILGIFTAITFAIFGGINTINSISSNLHISSSNPQNLGNLLIAAAVLGIVLFGVIMVLFAGIAKITEKDYKLPLLLNISIISTLTVMFLVGCIFTFTANGGWHWNQNTIPLPRVVFSIIVVVAVYFIAFYFYRMYKLKHLSDKKSNTGNQTDI